MLVRLLYASRCPSATPELIDTIVNQSRKNNPESGITGVLCHGGDTFLQVLEGGRSAVNEIYQRILQDKRHTQVTLLHYEEISQRRFASWTMGQVNLTRINPSLLLKYSERAVLDPFAVSGSVSMALLEDLIASASVVCRG